MRPIPEELTALISGKVFESLLVLCVRAACVRFYSQCLRLRSFVRRGSWNATCVVFSQLGACVRAVFGAVRWSPRSRAADLTISWNDPGGGCASAWPLILCSDLELYLADGLKGENLSKKAKEKREALIKRIKEVKLRYVHFRVS